MNYVKICHWNANGVYHHKLELEQFLNANKIDVMLISETHLTDKYNFKICGYNFYDTKHPERKGHGGTGILIRQRIRHYVLQSHCSLSLQATSICIQLKDGNLITSSVYCPPNHQLTGEELSRFFDSLGHKFIAAGDFNAKHSFWGSRLITPRGRNLFKIIMNNGYDIASCGQPTYWPTDRRKIPDLIDFAVTKNINRSKIRTSTVYDLSSDHSPVVLEYVSEVVLDDSVNNSKKKAVNWINYRKYISSHIELKIPLKTECDINNAINKFNELLTHASQTATPVATRNHQWKVTSASEVELAVLEKRRLRRKWQKHRSPSDKALLVEAVNKLKELLKDSADKNFKNYISELSSSKDTNYSLWKATKSLKRPQQHQPPIRLNDGEWARSDSDKAKAFANHLEGVFAPHKIGQDCEPQPLSHQNAQVRSIRIKSKLVQAIVKHKIECKKSPGYDNITGKMLKELPGIAFKHIAQIFNAIFRIGSFPKSWKLSVITMIPKPGKDPTKVSSYRPISLLPILSKVFEKVLLHKLMPKIKNSGIIPLHQFGFQAEHSTIEQVHRIAAYIRKVYEEKKYCSAIFLDVAQAFDKVWHNGLIYKIQSKLPREFHQLLKSYLSVRRFKVRYKSHTTNERDIKAGVPQGSVLGPMLYLLYTSDLPESQRVLTSTFADDTAILSAHSDPVVASNILQDHLNEVENWLKKWKIKVNENKSVHVTFTLNKGTCPPILLNKVTVPQADNVKYLGVHIDRRLTWKKHIESKRDQLKLKMYSLYWLIGRKSSLDLDLKVLLYNSILKPIWSYGCQLWRTASNSNIEIIQRVQSKILRSITNAPWYVKNCQIHKDLNIAMVKEELQSNTVKYAKRLTDHPNPLAKNLLNTSNASRLKKKSLAV